MEVHRKVLICRGEASRCVAKMRKVGGEWHVWMIKEFYTGRIDFIACIGEG